MGGRVTPEMLGAGQHTLDKSWRETSAYRVTETYLAMRELDPVYVELTEALAEARAVISDTLRNDPVAAVKQIDAILAKIGDFQ